MFQPWRLKLREAEEALRKGRLDEAGRLLRTDGLDEFLPARRLLAKVADQMAQRARRRVAGGQSMAGWRDLETAGMLGADSQAVAEVRKLLVDRRLAEAQAYLAAGEPAAAVARLDDMARHGVAGRELRLLEEAASKLQTAQRLCRQGRFAEAELELAAAAALAPQVKTLDETRKACRVKAGEGRRLAGELYKALAAQDWTGALAAAEALLELCPEHEAARDARRRAWAAVGMGPGGPGAPRLGRSAPRDRSQPPLEPLAAHMNDKPPRHAAKNGRAEAESPEPAQAGPRFLLWVDGVGGYLVCEADEVTLGQPVPHSQVDVPILADISRRHARIRRDGESYLIEPLRPVRLDGRAIEGVTSLVDGALIELGHGARLRFRRPHPLSATARLEFVSHHRTQPPVDAVILLAESCVLGPGADSHVSCPEWSGDVVLYRQGDALFCRAPGRFQIDGVAVAARGPITRRSQIVGQDFSISVEGIQG